MEKRNFVKIIGILIILAVACMSIAAQNEHKNPGRGFQAGASYSVSDIENINTTNGNLMLNIPLASLPKGRGEVGQSISLMYNSKLLDTSVEELPNLSNEITDQNMLVDSVDGGWKYAINTYELQVTSRFQTMPAIPCDGSAGDIGKNAYIWKVEMGMPDGSKKEFRPNGYNDAYNDGFFGINANGYSSNICTSGTTLTTSGDMTYYSTDGTYTRLVVNHVSGSQYNGASNSWTMSMPDGSRVTGGGGNNLRLYDRNGNYLEGTTDIYGRSISIQPNTHTNEDQVVMHGVGNEELRFTITWKTINVQKAYVTTAANDGRTRGGTSNQTYSNQYRVVDRITLPSQAGSLYYEFNYNCETGGPNGWGEVSKVRMPSGATASYEYTTTGSVNTGNVLKNYPSKKTLTYLAEYDGGSPWVSEETNYSIGQTGSTITGPDGTTITEYHGDSSIQNLMTGLVYKTTNSNGNMTEKNWAFNRPSGANSSENINAYVKTEYSTIANASGTPSLTSIKDYVYDPNGNQTEVREYDWVPYSSVNALSKDSVGSPIGIPSGAVLKRKTITAFNNSATGTPSNGYWTSTAPNVRNAASSVEVYDGSTLAARTQLTYDNAATTANVTQKGVLNSVTSGYITTSTTYDSYGNPVLVTDAQSVPTQITYGNVTVGGTSLTGPYPTQVITAYQTAVARTTTTAYDFYTGLPTSSTDVDNNATTSTGYDALGRATSVTAPNGATTVSTYSDTGRYVVVRSDIESAGDHKKVATQFYDQLGRVRLSKTLEDASTQSATNIEDGIKVQTRYKVTSGVTYQLTSNPYRAAYSYNANSGSDVPTMGWTLSSAVNTGRQSSVTTYDGAGLPLAFGGSNGSSTGTVSTSVDITTAVSNQYGIASTVTDQASKLRRSVTNALGQLIRVDEPNGSGQLDVSGVPAQPTNYTYDVLNNLTTVTQAGSGVEQCGSNISCTQSRTFNYSSLSRLTSATNPESGTISYAYDNNGNLTTKTDARGVATTYAYDALNRVTQRSYSGGSVSTPTVSYTYDDKTYAKGLLTKVSSSVSTTEYTSFDILGKVTGHKQTTDGTDYTTAYTYNLGGAMIEETYPSGRVVKNVLDASGDLMAVLGKKPTRPQYWNYASGITFNAAGAVTALQLGNGMWESTVFNARLQPTQIGLGTAQNGTDKLNLVYGYGSTQNNGNVQSQTITVPGMIYQLGQNYAYDSLNRLASATETSNSTQTWKQEFSYDRYGNRNFVTGSGHTDTLAGCTTMCNPTFSSTTNRITSSGYTFDSSGNTTADPSGRSFVYDGENKQASVSDGSGSIGQYFYDGDGKRVKKIVPSTGETTIFVYDAAGKQIAEYSTIVAAAQDAKVNYLTSDHLGSPRINTDANGAIISRHDYHPFGEEIDGTGGRTTGLNYGDDTVRKQFTGYERDDETGLDYAGTRYYAKKLGRFNSADRIMIELKRAVDPQGINRYVYARNNPFLYVDPNGKSYVGTDGKVVEVEFDKDGKIRKLGKNATADLQKLAGLVNNSGSAKALAQFKKGFESRTRFNVIIHPESNRKVTGDNSGLIRPHNAEGKPFSNLQTNDADYIQDDKTGKLVYKEVTIDLWEYGNGNEEMSPLWMLRETSNDLDVSPEEALVAAFGHEIHHGTDPQDINTVRGVRRAYVISNGQWRNYPHLGFDLYTDENGTENRAWRVTHEILDEIKAVRNVSKPN